MITTIIKTKNSSLTLCDALESIRDLGEIFVIDEHSTDETLDIAREYKAKIIYSLKPELDSTYNQILNEAQGEWIFLLEDNEIVPKKLVDFLKKYIEKPKKNFEAINLATKTFYYNNEIKAARKLNLRFFKKECFKISNLEPLSLSKKSKIYNHNKNFKKENEYILKYLDKSIISRALKFLDEIKPVEKTKVDLLKPIKTFLKIYFVKKACFEGHIGLIYAYSEAQKSFIYETMKLELDKKNDN